MTAECWYNGRGRVLRWRVRTARTVPLGDSQSVCDSTGMISVHWAGIPSQFNWKRVPSVSEIDMDVQNNQFSWHPDYQTMKSV